MIRGKVMDGSPLWLFLLDASTAKFAIQVLRALRPFVLASIPSSSSLLDQQRETKEMLVGQARRPRLLLNRVIPSVDSFKERLQKNILGRAPISGLRFTLRF